MEKNELKKQILDLTREYYREVHAPQPAFEAGKTRVNYGGLISTMRRWSTLWMPHWTSG